MPFLLIFFILWTSILFLTYYFYLLFRNFTQWDYLWVFFLYFYWLFGNFIPNSTASQSFQAHSVNSCVLPSPDQKTPHQAHYVFPICSLDHAFSWLKCSPHFPILLCLSSFYFLFLSRFLSHTDLSLLWDSQVSCEYTNRSSFDSTLKLSQSLNLILFLTMKDLRHHEFKLKSHWILDIYSFKNIQPLE